MRTKHVLGNIVAVAREYDPATTRTVRTSAARPPVGTSPRPLLQDLRYTYDPAGNVTRVVDLAQEPSAPTPLLRGATASTRRDFTYDAIHQLKTATGRVHQSLLVDDQQLRPLM